jgi:hypothetical protein
MTPQDITTGCFALGGSVAVLTSIIKLAKDRQVKGVSWLHVLFFTCWGWWNAYYFSWLGQWAAFTGGLLLVTLNTIWLGQLIYWSRK